MRQHHIPNRDSLAFHEAFADIVALFQHFTFPNVLRHQISRTRGDLASQNLLGELARHEANEVSIRMYRQGLGDCFLLTFPRKPRPFHMLLDCGALKSKHYGTGLMQKVVKDIREETNGHLDVVAATHQHWDHISGFYDARDIFKNFKVEKVWVAWTEQPNNNAAERLKDKFKKEKKAVEMALDRTHPIGGVAFLLMLRTVSY